MAFSLGLEGPQLREQREQRLKKQGACVVKELGQKPGQREPREVGMGGLEAARSRWRAGAESPIYEAKWLPLHREPSQFQSRESPLLCVSEGRLGNPADGAQGGGGRSPREGRQWGVGMENAIPLWPSPGKGREREGGICSQVPG